MQRDAAWRRPHWMGLSRIMDEDHSSAKFFISYRRRAPEDARLASLLVSALRDAGHEVFIDVDIPVGTDWSAEITRRIRWCDYLVVLLSEDSIDSEMVQGEIRLARHHRREDGSPFVFPVRVAYEGPLDYELTSYLGRLQHLLWRTAADDETVIQALLTAARKREGPQEAVVAPAPEPAPVAADRRRPRPAVDPSAWLRPTGTLRLDDPFYIERPGDAVVARLATKIGDTLVIKGARQVGKSSLLVRFIAACRQAGKRTAFVDFQGMSDMHLADYAGFLRRVACALLHRLDLPADPLPPIESGLDVTDLVETQILDRVEGPVVFAFDEVDRLLGRPWQRDFFGMLRSWHNRRWEDAWSKLDLALVIATEPYLLVDSADQSPFNVGEIVPLGPFSPRAVEELNQRYGSPLSAPQCQELFQLTHGQPYLTRVALYRLVSDAETSWCSLQTNADRDDGPFADHLKALLMALHRAGLEEAMREVIKRGRVPGNDRLTYYRLRGAGLVTEEDGRTVPANLLYARFFKQFLR